MLGYTTVNISLAKKNSVNVYLNEEELFEAIDDLTPTELKLFVHLYFMVLKKPTLDQLSNNSLAQKLGMTEQRLANTKSSLIKKDYFRSCKGHNTDGTKLLSVYIGKDVVALYDAGLRLNIDNLRQYRKILNKYPLLDKNIPLDRREKMVEQINTEYSK